jgi:ABC-type nitrate/sulfonate/bicarbonate transport system permease component
VKRVLGALPALLLLALFFGAWEVYVDTGGVDSLILPPPHQIAKALFTDRGLLWSAFRVTAEEVLLGIVVATAAGLVLATAIHFSITLRRAIYPLLVASQAIPIVLIAPLLVFWLGFGILPKLVVVALICFFPIVVTTLSALAAVDADLLRLMRTFDASRMTTYRQVEFPAALPGVFTGARVAITIAVIGAVLGEMSAGSNSGIGYVLTVSEPQLLTARAFAALTIVCVFAVLLFALLTLAERRLLPWAYQPRGDVR